MSDAEDNSLPMTEVDCAVCLQKCHHPTQLPCGHIFCFLCVKGVAIQNKKCAMCRAEIPPDYLDHPILLDNSSADTTNSTENSDSYQWYYEGRNGWWKYDERSNVELEASFNARETMCTLLLAGALYIIDFQNMTQVKRNDLTRRRRVKRDTPLFPAKGIAGIKTEDRQTEQNKPEEQNLPFSHNEVILINDDENSNDGGSNSSDDEVIVISDSLSTITIEAASSEIPAEEALQ